MAPTVANPNSLATRSIGMKAQVSIFFALLVFRLVNTHYVNTFFQPDEYFQALEPAWQLAFGPDSGAWLTWEWRERLRTSAHPYLFAAAYKSMDWLCRFFQTSSETRAEALVAAPGLLQAVFAALMDFCTWIVAVRVYGLRHKAAYAAVALTVLSPWQWYCSIRTFSNSLEATLTAVSLSLFPWSWFLEPDGVDKKKSLPGASPSTFAFLTIAPDGLYPALTAAAVAFYLRPTNLIIWMAISAGLVGCNRNYKKAAVLVQSAVLVGASVLVALAGVDFTYYGEWTFPPLRFLYFNVVQSLAVFYGRNRVDYYFTEGLHLLLTTALPFAIAGVWPSLRSGHAPSLRDHVERQTRFVFSFAVLVTTMTLSTIAHKEVRFLYPLLPILHVLAAGPFAAFFNPLPLPRYKLKKALLAALIASNIYLASYIGTTNQRGVIDVLHYLRHRQAEALQPRQHSSSATQALPQRNPNLTIAFLMPCHSTPWRSHLVYPEISAWALTCEPPINQAPHDRAAYVDEADVFYRDPRAWLADEMRGLETIADSEEAEVELRDGIEPLPSSDDGDDKTTQPQDETRISTRGRAKRPWPAYLVFFEHLEPLMKGALEGSRYRECRRFFNTHWIDDGRRKGDVVVWGLRR